MLEIPFPQFKPVSSFLSNGYGSFPPSLQTHDYSPASIQSVFACNARLSSSLYRSCWSDTGRHSDKNMMREADIQEICMHMGLHTHTCASKRALHVQPSSPSASFASHQCSKQHQSLSCQRNNQLSQSPQVPWAVQPLWKIPLAFKRGKMP